jgi:hypothetical protein
MGSIDLFTERFPFSQQGRVKDCKMMSPLSGDDGDEKFAMEFKAWAKANLETLTITGATAYFTTMFGEWTAKQLDHLNIEMPLQPWTVSGWMRDAGFVYSVYKKKYFVNTHEEDDVVLHRELYCAESLAPETRKACWIQMPLTEAKKMFKPPLIVVDSDEDNPDALRDNMYFEYRHEYHDDATDTMMEELHVCAFEAAQLNVLLEKKDAVWKELFGGCPSVRRNTNDKILIVFGQDESVFKAFAMNQKSWTREGIIRQKGEGPGMTVSAKQSYEYGFGLEFPDDVLAEINRIRTGEHY